ncbi:MAG TPA: hypothetical protein VM242_03230 [Acidimicrobiales bacterium]|jgi:hypothetical protein|nr:hypothetical protein [Acidimicrobiales bacterium]
MGPETVVTLIGVFLGVGAVAVYLIIIAYTLNKVSFTVGTVLIGVRAIASQTEPVGAVVTDILRQTEAIENALANLLGEKQRRVLRAPGRARALGA